MRRGDEAPAVFLVAAGGIRGHGGIGRMVGATVEHWRAAGLRPPLRVLDPYGSRLSPATALHLARTLVEIRRGARNGAIALVHIHMAKRGSALRKGVVAHWAALHDLRTVIHLHGSRLDEWHASLPAPMQRLLRRTLQRAERIIVPGEYWRGVVVDMVGIEAGRVRMVSNAVAGPPQVAARSAGSTCRLVFLGSLTREKGLHDLLRALADDAVAGHSWHLSVAGPGEARPFVELATALRIADRVELLGSLAETEVRALLARSDVFVLPSYNEGLSIALLEAMAHGCAVVATPVGANADAVVDGESGLLVPKGEPARLAAALRRLLIDTRLRAELQAGARQRWRARFDIAEHCRRLVDLYGEIRPDLTPF